MTTEARIPKEYVIVEGDTKVITLEEAQKKADEFNERHPLGSRVKWTTADGLVQYGVVVAPAVAMPRTSVDRHQVYEIGVKVDFPTFWHNINHLEDVHPAALDLLNWPFHYCIVPERENRWSGFVLEFPGCFAEGDTAEECVTKLRSAAESWLIACTEEQRQLLVPADLREFRRSLQKEMYDRLTKKKE